jgi:outer membrane protein OmpA-like peptidoglycan-associated protein
MVLRIPLLAALFSTILYPVTLSAQSLANVNVDARAQTLGEMTDDQVLETLRSNGRVSMSGAFFETDSTSLNTSADVSLSKIAKALEGMPDTRLAVVGHTDNTGDFGYNIELSQKRALAILTALQSAPYNIASDRLVSVGVGSIDPIVSNLSTEGKALNRRVTFVLLGDTEVADSSEIAVKGSWLLDPVTECEIWTAGDSVANEGATWTGACINGKASGRGSLIFWDTDGLEARYDGDVVRGKLHGSGVLSYRNEEANGFDTLDGQFHHGAIKGQGVLLSSDGYKFEGKLTNGVESGTGTLTTPDGAKIRGDFKDGVAVGPLLVQYETEAGELYFGDAENGKRHGFGILISENENFYAGDFENGTPSGSGFFEGADGSKFMGKFANGNPSGVGTAVDVEGTSYQGRFDAGLADGQILVTKSDGSQSIETWKEGGKVE